MTTIKQVITHSDIEIVAQLAYTIWRDHYIPILGKPQIDYMLAKFQSVSGIKAQIQSGFSYYIMNYGNKPVGYMAIKQEESALFLSKIYVLKVFRGKKIGKNAIDFIIKKAKTEKLKSIRLTVHFNNIAAIEAYTKLGFINNGPLVTEIGNGFIMDDYEFIKPIE